jgi:hypothetical protein
MSLTALLSSFARTRRVSKTGWKVLTGKEKRDFNKGKRSMKTGHLDQYANFKVVASMLPVYKVPDLANFKLKPYVAYQPSDVDEYNRKQGRNQGGE